MHLSSSSRQIILFMDETRAKTTKKCKRLGSFPVSLWLFLGLLGWLLLVVSFIPFDPICFCLLAFSTQSTWQSATPFSSNGKFFVEFDSISGLRNSGFLEVTEFRSRTVTSKVVDTFVLS